MTTRIALFTTECAQLGDALTEIIERHHEEIAVVLTSDVYRTARGGVARQTRDNIARSGVGFAPYLVSAFLLYPFAVRMDRLQARVTRRRHRRSVAELCDHYGIQHIHTGRVNSAETVAQLASLDLDHIFIYWFDQIIYEDVMACARKGVVNIHAAHLPSCRGVFPTLFTSLEDGTPFGATAHLIEDRRVDAGPILAQTTIAPPRGRSVLFNDSWVNRAGVGLFGRVLRDYDELAEASRPQVGGTYYSYPTRQQLREARRRRLRLVTVRDFVAAFLGTGAVDTPIDVDESRPPTTATR